MVERVKLKRAYFFEPPPLLVGEDPDDYKNLSTSIRAALQPDDVIDEMLIAEVTWLEWEVLRWRRWKASLMRKYVGQALEHLVCDRLGFDLYSDLAEFRLREILERFIPDDQARKLAGACLRDDRDAVGKVAKILEDNDESPNRTMNDAQAEKAKELAQAYMRRESDAVTLVDAADTSMDMIVADALNEKLDDIERMDRLTAVAESRRNACLREIDRRRAFLGEQLRRTMQEVEQRELKVLEPAAKVTRLEKRT